jgi:hypothetical protein
MKILFLVADEGGEDGSSQKQTNERSVNGNSDYENKEAKDTENGTNKMYSWAIPLGCACILAFGFFLFILFKGFSAFHFRERKISEENKQR